MAFEEFSGKPAVVEDRQAGIPPKVYKCTDGEMRDAYGYHEFESRVEWSCLGWTTRPPSQRQGA